MKQLIRSSGSFIIIAIGDACFVADVESDSLLLVQLAVRPSQPTTTTETTTTTESTTASAEPQQQQQQDDNLLLQIQAVDIHQDENNPALLHCAVARRDKSLAMYTVDSSTATKGDPIPPHIVHATDKRVTALHFATIPSQQQQQHGLLLLLAADVVGDATAWSTTTTQERVVVAGHTASMLTAVHCCCTDTQSKVLLTADRDEKIRVSSFPQTNIIQGYLLGHTAYVADMCVLPTPTTTRRIVSVGGDGTIRWWEQQLEDTTTTNLPVLIDTLVVDGDRVPAKVVAVNATTVAVLLDGMRGVQLYGLDTNNKTISLTANYNDQLAAQPLGMTVVNNMIYVLQSNSEHPLVVLSLLDAPLALAPPTTTTLQERLESIIRSTAGTSMLPQHVLERDDKGNIILEKVVDNRAETKPWLKSERVQINKERVRRKRANKKRKVEQEEEASKDHVADTSTG